MIEKMKKWRWDIIISFMVSLLFLGLLIFIGLEISSPEYAPFREDSYSPSPECMYGFLVAVFFGVMLLWSFSFSLVLDIAFSPKRKKKQKAEVSNG